MSHYDVQPPEAGAIASALEEIRVRTAVKTKSDIPISTMTSFRIGGPASVTIEPDDEDDLKEIGSILYQHRVPVLIVGRGSNILVSDSGFPGAVIRLGKTFDWIDGSGVAVRCGGATSFPQVANWATRRSLAGLEFAVAIPASVGGAVRMNAGAHASSVSDVLSQARIVDLEKGVAEDLARQDFRFAYRASGVRWEQVVVRAEFELTPGERSQITQKMESHREHRTRTQPSDAPNAGSMFKNHQTQSAGGLVEGCGLKGYRVGNAEISTKHANFFLAHPGATAQDIFDLMLKVQSTVLDKTGKLLIPEVRIVGRFERAGELVLQ